MVEMPCGKYERMHEIRAGKPQPLRARAVTPKVALQILLVGCRVAPNG
jgi:hypothetical protein